MHLPATAACVSGFQQIELQAHLLILLNRTPAESALAAQSCAKKPRPVCTQNRESLCEPGAFLTSNLSDPAVAMFRAIDIARGDPLPVLDDAAILHRQMAIVASAQGMHLAMNAHLLPLEACALPRSELAVLNAVSDASLLVELALHNRISRLRRRGCLGNGDGRRCSQCRHKYVLDKSHGGSPSVTAAVEVAPATHTR